MKLSLFTTTFVLFVSVVSSGLSYSQSKSNPEPNPSSEEESYWNDWLRLPARLRDLYVSPQEAARMLSGVINPKYCYVPLVAGMNSLSTEGKVKCLVYRYFSLADDLTTYSNKIKKWGMSRNRKSAAGYDSWVQKEVQIVNTNRYRGEAETKVILTTDAKLFASALLKLTKSGKTFGVLDDTLFVKAKPSYDISELEYDEETQKNLVKMAVKARDQIRAIRDDRKLCPHLNNIKVQYEGNQSYYFEKTLPGCHYLNTLSRAIGQVIPVGH